jgi:hypothetical protein
MEGIKIGVAIIVVMMTLSALPVFTENVSAAPFNVLNVTLKAQRTKTWGHQGATFRVYHNIDLDHVVATIETDRWANVYLNQLSNQIAFWGGSEVTGGDNSPSTTMDTHYYLTGYGYLPRNYQGYSGIGRVGQMYSPGAPVYSVDISTGIGARWYGTCTNWRTSGNSGNDYRNFWMEGTMPDYWDNLNVASASTKGSGISIYVYYKTATFEWGWYGPYWKYYGPDSTSWYISTSNWAVY